MKLPLGLVAVAMAAAVLAPVAPARADPTVVNVPADVPTIQAGIDAVAAGGTVVVAAGVYQENVDYKGKAVEVRSSAGPSATVIDGGGVGPGVTLNHGEPRAAILRGFTVRNAGPANGAGAVVVTGSASIIGNIVTGNHLAEGGGIYTGDGAPLIEGNVFRGNEATWGGGIRIIGAGAAEIVGNLFEDNKASFGGGIEMWTAGNTLIQGNVFRGNTAAWGGAISTANYNWPFIVQNVFVGNHAGSGGAMDISGATGGDVVNNTFVGNTSSLEGAALDISTDWRFVNNVLVNAAGDATPIVHCDTTILRFFNNAFFNGTENPLEGCPATLGIVGNTAADPRLQADLCPAAGSPAVDAGDYDPLDPLLPGTDFNGAPRMVDGDGDGTATVDMGAFERPGGGLAVRAEASTTDVDFGAVAAGSTATRTVSVIGSGFGLLPVGGATVTTGQSMSVTAGGCQNAVLSLWQQCDLTVAFTPTAVGPRTATLTVATGAGPVTVALRGVGTAGPTPLLQSPSTAWTQPSAGPFDGMGAWTVVAAEMVAGPGQPPPSYLFGHVFRFSTGGARGAVALLQQGGQKYALFTVKEANGTEHPAVVPFAWKAGRFYFLYTAKIAPGQWGAWVYDNTAATWTGVGLLALPDGWGTLQPASTTTVLWTGDPAPSCAAYPLADVYVSPPFGYVGSTPTMATPTATTTGPGACVPQTTTEGGVWMRYRLGTA